MSLNTKSAAPLLKGRSRFAKMQAAELEWWRDQLQHETARQRMYALYGARYYPFFWQEMRDAGDTVEIGSGPLPVMDIMGCHFATAVDTLAYGGLTDWHINTDISIIPDTCADTVLLLNVLDHTDDPQKLVGEALRILRPGGRALVFVHLGPGDDKHVPIESGDCGRWLGAFGEVTSQITPATEYDPSAYVAVAVKHG